MRVCSKCKSDRTYITPEGYQEWRYHNNQLMCKKCYRLIIGNRYNRIHSPNRITFKNRRISIKSPRIGVCNLCRNVAPFDCKRTHWHHDDDRYDDSNPLKYGIEACPKCHRNETRLLHVGLD